MDIYDGFYTMIRNYLILSFTVAALCACQYYSDEMSFYFEDENAAPEALAAPTEKVSSKDLVIPEELRPNNSNTTSAQNKTREYTFPDEEQSDESEDIPPSDTVSAQTHPQSLIVSANEKVSVSETKSIPLSSNENTAENITTATETTVFNSAEINPNVYAIAATRATNKMLDDTQRLYRHKDQKPKLLVMEAKKNNPKLPDGFHYADKVIYDIIDGSQNFMMVTKLDDADYVLNVAVDAFPNSSAQTPIIVYTLTLQDTEGNEIDSWEQDIRQLQNDDKSWW